MYYGPAQRSCPSASMAGWLVASLGIRRSNVLSKMCVVCLICYVYLLVHVFCFECARARRPRTAAAEPSTLELSRGRRAWFREPRAERSQRRAVWGAATEVHRQRCPWTSRFGWPNGSTSTSHCFEALTLILLSKNKRDMRLRMYSAGGHVPMGGRGPRP